jgi:hypothetical protein
LSNDERARRVRARCDNVPTFQKSACKCFGRGVRHATVSGSCG